jgi:hypothetical protein
MLNPWSCASEYNVDGLRYLARLGQPLDTCGHIFGVSPLHMAVLGPHAQQILLEQHPSSNSSVLVRSAKLVYVKLVKSAQIKPSLQTDSASKQKQTSILSFLLTTCKVHVDACDKYGRTPLMLVPMSGSNDSCAEMLLRSGASIGAKDLFGNTPLHYAYAFSFGSAKATSTTISLYLAAGSSPCQVNAAGLTPKEVMGNRHKIFT